jgi:Polyketide cyclase / dehydrase and lipid transport
MVTVRVSMEMPVERERVWDALARLEDHVEWMQDATAIRFQSAQRRGVGTTFECDTKVGPIRLTDTMDVTEWDQGERIGVRHRGAVSGTGRFLLTDAAGPATMVEWEEQLSFPWWLGASAGALLAKPLFGALWRGNLRRLCHLVSESATGGST